MARAKGSLRQAIDDANAILGADKIMFDGAVFDGEAGDLIRLTSGQIEIADGLTIVGGPSGVTITGDAAGDDVTLAGGITNVDASGDDRLDDNSRIFDATAALTLDGLTLTGGRTTGNRDAGGAVRCTIELTLSNCTISRNSTSNLSYGEKPSSIASDAGAALHTSSTLQQLDRRCQKPFFVHQGCSGCLLNSPEQVLTDVW